MGVGDYQLFGEGMFVVPLRGKNSRTWYCLGYQRGIFTFTYIAISFRASSVSYKDIRCCYIVNFISNGKSAMLVGCGYKDELKFMIIIIIEFEYKRFVINVNIIIK